MPKQAKQLSAAEVGRIHQPGLHSVGGVPGLMLQVTRSRARSWVLRATIAGNVRDMGLGSFSELSLKQAREDAREARRKINNGRDPIEERKRAKRELAAARAKRLSFAEAARATYEAKQSQWQEGNRKKDWVRSLERHVFPIIGDIDVSEVELPHIQKVLKPIWHDKTALAVEIRRRLEAVLTWATVSGYRTGENPARWKGNLDHVLPRPSKIHQVRHHPALPWHDMPDFMVRLRQQGGMAARALQFAILTAARSGEVRHATWSEIDFNTKTWTVPAERAKAGKTHHVPLPDDAIRLLKALPRDNELVFPAPRGGVLSDMALNRVCKRMKVDAVPHGFRSSFKDWARSRTRYADEVSELALAHVNSDATRAAYARDELLPQRKCLMRDWAKFLRENVGKAASDSNVTPIGTEVAHGGALRH